MSCQDDFVGYSLTRKNPKRFHISSGCSIDGLKNVIKQVLAQGIPPYGIHESQTVRRLFFRWPGHSKYSENVIKFKIIELKTDDDLLKVLVQSNYWKRFGPIEILTIFSKPVIKMEDNMSPSQHDSMQN